MKRLPISTVMSSSDITSLYFAWYVPYQRFILTPLFGHIIHTLLWLQTKISSNAALCALTAALTELVFSRNSCRFGVTFLSWGCRGQRTLLLNWTLLKQQKYKKTPLFYICFYTYWITKERQKCMYCVLKNKTTKDKSNTKSWENASGTKVCYNAKGPSINNIIK